jgi:hypothetical protein
VTIGGCINFEAVAYGPDVFHAAKQADTVSTGLTLQAMLFEQLTKLTHVLHIYVAVRIHAPLTSSVGSFTVIKRKGSARSSMVADSGRASLADLGFVRTLREGASLMADLFEGIPKTVSERKTKWEKGGMLAGKAGCSPEIGRRRW